MRWLAFAFAFAVLAACRAPEERAPERGGEERAPAALDRLPFADGSWSVVRAPAGLTLLVREPRSDRAGARPPRGEPAPPPAPEVRAFRNGRDSAVQDVEVLPLELPAPLAQRALWIGHARVGSEAVWFPVHGASPPLLATRGGAIFEEAGTLWELEASGAVRQLVADSVAGFVRRELAARQREGVVILYWAAAPVPDPAGRLVAYATNREALQGGARGQSIWLLDRETGTERPLVAEPGRSYRPAGWLGRELVYFGDEPGVWAVAPQTGLRRRLAEGFVAAAAANGSAVAVVDGLPDSARVTILSIGAATTIPPAPRGLAYAADAAWSPDGRRLVIAATGDTGRDRALVVFDRRSGSTLVHALPAPPEGLTAPPAWVDDRTLLLNLTGSDRTPRAYLLRVE